MNPAQPGDLLAARYRLNSVIGHGGMGVVWAATDELLARHVAIKETIWPAQLEEADRAAIRERSLREARTAARLSHPGIVSVYDVVDHDERAWLVMQLVPFPSLRDVVASDGPLRPGQAADVGLKVLDAICAAHQAGVLHRDVKPANVLLGPGGQVYLTDFGLAVSDGNPAVTMAGVVMGSPAYMAPERAKGEPAVEATDLWALGATLYACVEGRDPFAREGTIAVLTAIVADEPDAPARAGPLWPVIAGLLRKEQHDRLDAPQAARMLAGVRDLCAGAQDQGATGPLAVPPGGRAASTTMPDLPVVAASAFDQAAAPVRKRGRRRLAGALAAVAAVTAVGIAADIMLPATAGKGGGNPAVAARSRGAHPASGHRHRGTSPSVPVQAVSTVHQKGKKKAHGPGGHAHLPPGHGAPTPSASPDGSPSVPPSPSAPPPTSSPSPTAPPPSPTPSPQASG